MPPFIAALLASLSAKIVGAISSAFSTAFSFLKSGIQDAVFYQKQGIATARELGMTYQQSIAYTETLTKRTKDLAMAYGLTKEQIAEIQKTISQSTVRNLMLTDEDARQIAKINKLVGSQTTGAFTEAIVNTMGGQLSTMEGAVSKAYATAAKSGLNAAKFSEKVAQNLRMANKFAFRDGVEGLTRMTALSEKLGYNLATMEAAAGKFDTFESAIETSAHLNMLGGSAGIYGSNPLQLMYERNYDPEKFNKTMTDMLKSYGQFNKKTGMGEVGAVNMDIVKQIANTLGIDMNEAVSIAKNSAVVRYKESVAGGSLDRIAGDNQMMRDFILNKSQIDEKGRMFITDERGKAHYMNELESGAGRKWLEETYARSNKSDAEIIEESAQKLTDVNERIAGMMDTVRAYISETIGPYLQRFSEWLAKDGRQFIDDYVIPGMKGLMKGVKWLVDGAIEHPIATAVIVGVGSVLTGAFRIMASAWVSSLLRSGSATTRAVKGLGDVFKGVGGGITKAVKGLSIGAAVTLGADLGLDYLAKKGIVNDNASWFKRTKIGLGATGGALTGAALGSLAGPVGTAIGGILGGVAGGGYEIYNQYQKFKEDQEKLGREVNFWDFVRESAIEWKKELINNIHNFGKFINDGDFRKEVIATFGSKVKQAFVALGDDVNNLLNMDYITEMSSIKESFDKFLTTYKDVLIEAPLRLMTGGLFTDDIRKAFGVPDYIKTISDGIHKVLTEPMVAIRKITDPINDFIDYMSMIPTFVKMFAKEKLSAIGLGDWIDAPDMKEAHDNRVRHKVNKNTKAGGVFGSMLGGAFGIPGAIIGWGFGKNLGYHAAIGHEADRPYRKKLKQNGGFFSDGGVVGGNYPVGDKIRAYLNSGEYVLTQDDQKMIVTTLEAVKDIKSMIVAKPLGEKEYIYKPKGGFGGGDYKINDFTIHINGEIKLNGGNGSTNFDARELLNDHSFVKSLKDMIKESISRDMQGGRVMNDVSMMRGMPLNQSVFGKANG